LITTTVPGLAAGQNATFTLVNSSFAVPTMSPASLMAFACTPRIPAGTGRRSYPPPR
jgi:hypothetical protein